MNKQQRFARKYLTTKDQRLNQPDYAYDNHVDTLCPKCGWGDIKLNTEDGKTCPACGTVVSKK